ncbi:MAG: hypothetical protein ABIO33_06670, partial [Leifsonia sp.]
EWGQVPVVVAVAVDVDVDVAAAGASVTPTEPLERIRGVVGEALGPAARPARVVGVSQIPLLASGKPDRQALAGIIGRV